MIKVFIYGSPHFIDKQQNLLVPKDENNEIEIYFGEELNKSDFFAYVNSVSLFGTPKFAIIRNAAKISDRNKFIKNLSFVTETSLIVSSEYSSGKQDEEIIKSFETAGFKKIEEKNAGKATSYDIVDIFKKKGLTLSESNAKYILNTTGGDMLAAENEAEKIALFLANNKNKTADDVMEHIAGEWEEKIYMVTMNFAEKSQKKALQVYNYVQHDYENNMLMFVNLMKFLMNLYLSYIDPSLADIKTQFQRNLMENKRYWTQMEVAQIIGLMAELDAAIKTGQTGLKEAIETILLHPLAEKNKLSKIF